MLAFSSYDAKVLFFLITILFSALWTANRERHGGEWCRKKFVGRMRPRLNPMIGVVSISTARQDGLHLAVNMLKEHCRTCGGCDLAKDAPP
jgi:hypothetical protein